MSKNRFYLGGILVLLGLLAMMWALGLISEAHLDVIYTLWPVLIIVFGINLFVKRFQIMKLGIWVTVFVLFLYLGVNRSSYDFIKSFEYDLISRIPKIIDLSNQIATKYSSDDSAYGKLIVEGIQINLNIVSNGDKSSEFSYPNRSVDVTNERIADKSIYRLRELTDSILANEDEDEEGQKKSGISGMLTLDAVLDKKLIWDVLVNTGVLTGTLDLSDTTVSRLTIETGAGNISVKLGKLTSDSEMNILSAASSVELSIPADAGVKIVKKGIMTKVDFVGEYSEFENVLTSSNFDNADQKLTIDIENALGKFTIHHK